jgi:hypothetical protein
MKQQIKKQKNLDVVSFLSQQQLCMLKMAATIISPPSMEVVEVEAEPDTIPRKEPFFFFPFGERLYIRE